MTKSFTPSLPPPGTPERAVIDEHRRRARARRWRENHGAVIAEGKRRYAAANRDKINAQMREWRARNRDKTAAHNAKWYARNRESVLANRNLEAERAYREANREQRKLAKRAWVDAHPAEHNAYSAERRARVRGAFVEKVDFRVVWERDSGICHICREPADPTNWHLEHVVPLARGGTHSYANTAVSHPTCNLRKGAR